MKRILFATLVSLAFGVMTTPACANDANHPKAETQKSYSVKGQVVEVDKTGSKIKLKHEAVPELNWPAMTMFFAVAEKPQLDALKVGDWVAFEFVNTNNGGPLITQIKPVK